MAKVQVKLLNDLIVMPRPDIDMYEVFTPFRFMIGQAEMFVPSRFVFDGASIPKVFHSIITTPYDPNIIGGGCIHDYLYRTHEVGKKMADRVLRQVNRIQGLDEMQCQLVYTAVRFGGHLAYKNGEFKPLTGTWDPKTFTQRA